MEGGFEEAAGLGLGGGELGFQAVAEGHQFIDFGDDAVLFGEWWDRNGHLSKRLPINVWLSGTTSAILQLCPICGGFHEQL